MTAPLAALQTQYTAYSDGAGFRGIRAIKNPLNSPEIIERSFYWGSRPNNNIYHLGSVLGVTQAFSVYCHDNYALGTTTLYVVELAYGDNDGSVIFSTSTPVAGSVSVIYTSIGMIVKVSLNGPSFAVHSYLVDASGGVTAFGFADGVGFIAIAESPASSGLILFHSMDGMRFTDPIPKSQLNTSIPVPEKKDSSIDYTDSPLLGILKYLPNGSVSASDAYYLGVKDSSGQVFLTSILNNPDPHIQSASVSFEVMGTGLWANVNYDSRVLYPQSIYFDSIGFIDVTPEAPPFWTLHKQTRETL